MTTTTTTRDLQQTSYRVVFDPFVLQFTGAPCTSTTAQSLRDGMEDCLRVYSRERCNIDAAYIGLGGAVCVNDEQEVLINGGVFSFNGMDALPATIANCVKEASYSETCDTVWRAALPALGTIQYAEVTSSSESDPPSDVPSFTPVATPSVSPSALLVLSTEPSISATFVSSLAPSAAPTAKVSDITSQVPSLVPVAAPSIAAPPTATATRVPTTTSGIVNEPAIRSQNDKTVPLTTVAVGFAALLLLAVFVFKKRERNSTKARFTPMDDDESSNASGFIGIAPLQTTNQEGDLEQAVEISLKKNNNDLNKTLSTTASSSPEKQTPPKTYRHATERSLPRPELTPRNKPRPTTPNSIPFDEELPSNPTPTVVQKEICGTSWWKQMNATKVRNPTLCPYTPLFDDGLCCPTSTSVPSTIHDKATVKDDVSDFELDWDPEDDTSTENEYQAAVVTPPSKSQSSELPPLRKKSDSRLLLGASSRRSDYSMDQIIAGSEKEV